MRPRLLDQPAEDGGESVKAFSPTLKPRLVELDSEISRLLMATRCGGDVRHEHAQQAGGDQQFDAVVIACRAAREEQLRETSTVGLPEDEEEVAPCEEQPAAGARLGCGRPFQRGQHVAVVVLELVEDLERAR